MGELVNGRAPRAFDAVITSPPYATALPYIDTQRLSLVLLGLIGADELRATEAALVGAREITIGERRALEAELYFYGRIFGFSPADTLEAVDIENLPEDARSG